MGTFIHPNMHTTSDLFCFAVVWYQSILPWWRHQVKTFSALLLRNAVEILDLLMHARVVKMDHHWFRYWRGVYFTPRPHKNVYPIEFMQNWDGFNQENYQGMDHLQNCLQGVFKVHDFLFNMMTSSNGNIFRVTCPLCGEFTGPRWIPRTGASDAELWCFLWSAPK